MSAQEFLVVASKRDHDDAPEFRLRVYEDYSSRTELIKSPIWIVQPGLTFKCSRVPCGMMAAAGVVWDDKFVPVCDEHLAEGTISESKLIVKKRFSIMKAPQLIRRRFARELADPATPDS